MSQKRIYVWSEEAKRLVPAWGENEEWGPAHVSGHSGALVVGQGEATGDRNKRLQREAMARLRAAKPRCNVVILAEPCSRPAGHPGRHRHYWNRAA